MSAFFQRLLGITTLVTLLGLYLCAKDAGNTLSPQGCEMSWMSPSYILQTRFNESWSPLATRYSLWLYREVGWNAAKIGNSFPVLFIPGNAGSSHQARSIASSAARQYYGSPGGLSPEFILRTDMYRPLDVYAVEFNEDLSAFHGTTLQSQIDYTAKAISYILSMYPPNTQLLVLGHSMGGIVATSLLPSPNISAIITMATPFAMPPARFEASVDAVYDTVHDRLAHDPTPILSLCAGATDKMIPSESCIIPHVNYGSGWRRTVFTSALEGSWTGVGHEVIVWCHQVRWRVAKAALELSPLRSTGQVVEVLDRWMRDGHTLPPNVDTPETLSSEEVDTAKVVDRLVLDKPQVTASGTYRIHIPQTANKLGLTVLLSQGTINSIGPHRSIPLKVSAFKCSQSSCSPLPPTTLKLLPSPVPGQPFPVPSKGSGESEGVVLFVGNLSSEGVDSVILKVEYADGRGWVVANLDEETVVQSEAGIFSAITGGILVPVSGSTSLNQKFSIPSLLSHVLVAYRVKPLGRETSCSNILFPPLLEHDSNEDEIHYFALGNPGQPGTILHTHSPAPFIPNPDVTSRGVHFKIYSSGLDGCERPVEAVSITIDWPTTFSRWATRYWMSALSWSAGTAALVVAYSWDSNRHINPLHVSLERFSTRLLPRLMGLVFVMAFVPFSKTRYLGTGGEPSFSIFAPVILAISTGLVVLMWWILEGLLAVLRKAPSMISTRAESKNETASLSRNTLASITVVCLAILLFIPWQVAFLGCWVFHLYSCAARSQLPEVDRIQHLYVAHFTDSDEASRAKEQEERLSLQDNANLNMHLLLLMTWLLPLVAPILAVWVRTLMTAGYTTPFNGDHNVLNVLPFLILVDFASWTPAKLLAPTRFDKWLHPQWTFATAGGIAFIFGSRNPYVVFRAIALVVGILVCKGIGRRYWRGVTA